MKVYVCPVCDHMMSEKYYCRNCHQFVKQPYYIDKNYSLERNVPEFDVNMETSHKKELCSETKKSPKKSPKQIQKKTKKTRHHILWLIMIYAIFQIGMMVYAQLPKDRMDKIKQEITTFFSTESKQELLEPEKEEEAIDWVYQTPDYDEIIEQGEESTGLTHFAINGDDFTNKIHQVLNDADFDVIEHAEYMENYIASNLEQSEEYSYFRNITTFYLTNNYMEYYRIVKDSVSGRLIDTEIESRDYDQVCFFVKAAASLLFSDNKKKQEKIEKLEDSLERLLEEETYFSEEIGNMIVSGYTYTSQDTDINQEESVFHISLSRKKNAKNEELT